jgi:hypothetical protein
MKRATFTSCPQLAKRLVVEAPHPSVTKPLATKAKLAQLPPTHQALLLKTLVKDCFVAEAEEEEAEE